ncbi:hypothetical protein KDH_48830 [Dictyobacter sp. S3.2.2.5]|uniref:Uncharacterized protein n=1 Tax=Dictyobacter halimunensis TaxID=3026934 RepID=A0ABQ6FUX0_9CHLR|nr:hypothetical protein KDH_48830 [Dictyobacter sp. S3.2.2.5]
MVSSTAAPVARPKKGYREYATVATRLMHITKAIGAHRANLFSAVGTYTMYGIAQSDNHHDLRKSVIMR